MKADASRIAYSLALAVLFGAATLAQGQEDVSSPLECSRIDKTRPPLFITFEHVESKQVFLRLHNNSRCKVLIPTNQLGPPSGRAVRQPNGGFKIEPTEELRDGSRVPVVYNLFNLRGSKGTVIVSAGCIIMTWQLLPQRSVIFGVPLVDFKKHADVGVQFGYPWEDDGGSAIGGGFGHYVFFHNVSLPHDIIR